MSRAMVSQEQAPLIYPPPNIHTKKKKKNCPHSLPLHLVVSLALGSGQDLADREA